MARGKRGLRAGEKAEPGKLEVDENLIVAKDLKTTLAPVPEAAWVPHLYSPELGERICDLTAAGVTMTKLCTLEGMPTRMTLWRWLSGRVEGVPPDFRERFNEARNLHLAFMASEILDIADDGSNDTYIDEKGNRRIDSDVIARSRLRVETRQWMLMALLPEQFAKKAHFEHKHELKRINDLSIKEIDALLIDLEAEQVHVDAAAAGAEPQAAPAPRRRAESGKGKAVH